MLAARTLARTSPVLLRTTQRNAFRKMSSTTSPAKAVLTEADRSSNSGFTWGLLISMSMFGAGLAYSLTSLNWKLEVKKSPRNLAINQRNLS